MAQLGNSLNFHVITIYFQNFCIMAENDKKKYSKEELKKRLTPVQYHVTQEKGTERYTFPFEWS